MPPKAKITKQDILQAALDLLRQDGETAINARSIATALSCSTQPIFSNFATMEALQEAVAAAAYEHYLALLRKEAESGKYLPYKAFGMAYIRFAREEKEMFKLLFMCDRRGEELDPTADFTASIDMISRANGISHELATRWHMEMWALVHGIGTMIATSFLSLDEDTVSAMLTDVYQGLRATHTAKEESL